MQLIPFGCRLCIVVCAFALSTLIARAETRLVEIETQDGRALQGVVDQRSDAQALWVRRTEGNVILATNVAWGNISTAAIDGEPVEVSLLESNFQQLKTSAPTTFLTEFEPLQSTSRPLPAIPWDQRRRITSIEVDAAIVNLDRTVESDGLVAALAVFDDHGVAMPVRGSLSARLIVERLDQHTGAVTFEEFQRWSVPVSPRDFRDGIAELPLRYRRASPEFRWDLCTAALLNVRLGVPGAGNFEASVPVAIQEFNPIRDEMRNQQGYRFYRDELTHDTRHDGPRQLHRGYSSPRGYGF
jgi:hypothetical protein